MKWLHKLIQTIKGERMNTLKNGMKIIDYYTLYRDDIRRLEICLNNFNYEDACPYCLKALAQYKHYNVVLNKDYLLGPSETIWDFTINDKPYTWKFDLDFAENQIRPAHKNPQDKILEQIVKDLCDVLNMLVEKGEIESTDDTSSDWQPKHY